MEENCESAPKKRKLCLNPGKCCFCKTFGNEHESLTVLNNKKVDNLISACKSRHQDEFSCFVLENEENIKQGETVLNYHKSCRSRFMHPFYSSDVDSEKSDNFSANQFTRSKAENFDWKSNCFICGKKCHQQKRSTWSVVESAIDNNSKLYCKVLEAAKLRNDRAILNRLLSSNGDLVAVEARYHRQKGCLSHYISERNINFANKTPEKGNPSKVCEILKGEYEEAIISQKVVYELSTLKNRFFDIAVENDLHVNHSLSSYHFKQLLLKTWPNLRFVSRKGLTDLVCSNFLSVEEAVVQMSKVESRFAENIDNEFEFINDNNHMDDNSVLHKAAIILRNRVKKYQKVDKEYLSPEEISQKYQKEFLDPLLLRFIYWLSSKQNVDEGKDVSDDVDQKVLAIASDITTLISPNCITPKHLGLTIHLHHTFGSKKLIEDLSALGYVLPYSEVRHFLTSAALHMSSSQDLTPSGGLVPTNISAGEDSGTLIVAAADNWDHNEHTLSGKSSTHAMTSILVVPQSLSSESSARINRVQERAVDVSSLPGRGLSHVVPYVKPNERPQPFLSPPVTVAELKLAEPASNKILRLKELLYNMGRCSVFCDDRATNMPPWTVYQSNVESDILDSPSKVLFNPIIMASPTDVSTVYTTLKRTKEQLNSLGQSICPIVFDMGLLSKALEVLWAKKEELEGVVLLEGGMHFLMACFAGIGNLYGEIGLRELLYESDVFAKNTAEHILSGKDFDRALRAVVMVDEVLNKRFLIQFKLWLEKNSTILSQDVLQELAKCDLYLFENRTEELNTFLEKLNTSVIPLIEQFRTEGREISPLFQFWDDYMTNISLPIKLYLASSRHAKWDVHHYSKCKLLPFLFASNRTTYARYMTYILLSMNRLPEKVLESFSKGYFVAKLTNGIFNSVWIDYVLEVTENKSLKSSGGIIGLTHQDNALARWFLSRPLTAKYSMAYKSSVSQQQSPLKHHTDTTYYRKSFNSDVSKMNDLFEDTFIDPFSITNAPSRLVNFATGVETSIETEMSLLNCLKEGHTMMEKFVSERLVVQNGQSEPAKRFFDPMPKSKVKTVKKSKSLIKCKSTDVFIGGEEMYLRLLAINSFKKVPLDRVMSFENAPVPLSLFGDDGKMIANKKSDYMGKLESLIDPELILKSVDSVDSIVYDGMAIIQMLQPVPSPVKPTYSDLAALFWRHILDRSTGVKCVHVVFDRYEENSLKAQTREKRGDMASVSTPSHIQSNMKVKDWKKFLTSSKSKSQLTEFYTKYFCEHAHEVVPIGQTLYVSGGLQEQALEIKQDVIAIIHELESNQEEADTRMLLHVKYSGSLGAKRVVVVSPDTDVLVLLVHHYSDLGVLQLLFKTGRKGTYSNYTRFIPVHDIVDNLSVAQRQILMPIYCLTGCDTCSSLFGIGKKKVFKLLLNNADEFQEIRLLGNEFGLSAVVRARCVQFVGLLYGSSECVSLNKIRVEKVLKNKRLKPKSLPPTDDSFFLHLLRCTYQLIIWKGCLSAKQRLPDPLDFGYIVDDVTMLFKPQLMSQPAAPPELLSDLVCICIDTCENDCVCSANEQPCTQACECKAYVDGDEVCKNVFTILASIQDDNSTD